MHIQLLCSATCTIQSNGKKIFGVCSLIYSTRMKAFVILLAASTTAALLCQTAGGMSVGMTAGEDTFDYFMFSHEWPYSFCTANKCVNTDKLQPLFNIHGLWPEHVSGACEGKFNYSELKPLEEELLQWWMNLEDPLGSAEKFWTHEYDKHGRCASADSRFATTYLYFKAALDLHTTFTLTDMLNMSGIHPGPNPVKVSSIRDALKSSFGYEPVIACINKDGTTYLLELRVCFEKDFTRRDCDSSISRRQQQQQQQAASPVDGGSLLFSADPAGHNAWGRRDSAVDSLNPFDEATGLSQMRSSVTAQVCQPDAEVLLPDKLGY